MSNTIASDHFWYSYKTTTNNLYPIKIGFGVLKTKDIQHNKRKTSQACQLGCKLFGKNGGCPPFSPNFANLRERFEFSYVVFIQLRTKYFPQKVMEGNYYVRWSFVEILQGNLLKKISLNLGNQFDGYLLSSGHCVGCGQKSRCTFSVNNRCKNPKNRLFSMESTGILVTDLMANNFDLPLFWFNKDPNLNVPPYMVKTAMLMSNESIPILEFQNSMRCFLSNRNKGEIIEDPELKK